MNNAQPPISGGSLYDDSGGSESYRECKATIIQLLVCFLKS